MMPLVAWSFIKSNWKTICCALALVAAFIGGRASVSTQPERITEKTVEKVQFVDRWHERVIEKQIKVRDETTNLSRHREVTKVEHPDGTKVFKEVEDLNIDKIVKETETKFVDRVVDRIVFQDREVKKETIIESPQKNWLVGPMIGFRLAELGFRDGGLQLPVEFGAQVQRRVLGPVFIGAYGMHKGTAGLTVSFEF